MSDNQKSTENYSGNPIRLLLHIPVPWVFVLAYLIGIGLQILVPFGPPSATVLIVSTWLGIALLIMGAIFAGWSLFIFNRAHTTTVPGEASAQMVTWGPYRVSRNPMYVGLTVAYLGEAAWLKQIWPILPLLLTLAYINRIVIPLEEARLKEVFGDKYAQYCSKVRRWI